MIKTALACLAIVTVSAFSTGFTGCSEPLTPQDAVLLTFKAVRDEDPELLKKVSSGKIQERFASKQGIADFRGDLAGINPKLGQAQILEDHKTETGGYRIYSVDVFNMNEVTGRPTHIRPPSGENKSFYRRVKVASVRCDWRSTGRDEDQKDLLVSCSVFDLI